MLGVGRVLVVVLGMVWVVAAHILVCMEQEVGKVLVAHILVCKALVLGRALAQVLDKVLAAHILVCKELVLDKFHISACKALDSRIYRSCLSFLLMGDFDLHHLHSRPCTLR